MLACWRNTTEPHQVFRNNSQYIFAEEITGHHETKDPTMKAKRIPQNVCSIMLSFPLKLPKDSLVEPPTTEKQNFSEVLGQEMSSLNFPRDPWKSLRARAFKVVVDTHLSGPLWGRQYPLSHHGCEINKIRQPNAVFWLSYLKPIISLSRILAHSSPIIHHATYGN